MYRAVQRRVDGAIERGVGPVDARVVEVVVEVARRQRVRVRVVQRPSHELAHDA